ncbi:MAG: 3D domain-containing protein, partial [Verrucomicrobiia bacterium]
MIRDLLLAFCLAIFFALCGLAHGDTPRRFTARITYYEPRSCPYGNVTSTGRYAVEGVTCAVDPRVIPYGSRIRIPALDGFVGDGWFLAQDTGSAVKSR